MSSKYIVTVREVYHNMIEVVAESHEEALEKAHCNDGTFLDGTLEYSHTLDSSYSTVEKEAKIP